MDRWERLDRYARGRGPPAAAGEGAGHRVGGDAPAHAVTRPAVDGSAAAGWAAPVDWLAAVDALDAALVAEGTPERAEQERRYLKSALRHHGASMPAIRRVWKAWRGALEPLDRDGLRAFVDEAWGRGVHELREAAVEALVEGARLLAPADLAWLERLLRETRTWALVDPLAAQVVGALRESHPEVAPTIDRWADDPDHWLRRSALLVHLLPMRRGNAGAFAPFAAVAERLLADREFFVRKAIGWVLREHAKRCPDEVFAWLRPRAPLVAGLTLREAAKPLPDAMRAELLATAGRR